MTKTATSTGLTKARGYDVTRFNALRHGILSRHTVLPWEDDNEYRELLDALLTEHKPQGPTEEHLVEELAGILWRKRRLRLAKGAACRRGLQGAPSSETIHAALAHLRIREQDPGDAAKKLADLDRDQAVITCAVELLQAGKARAYDKALGTLYEETQERWAELTRSKPNFELLNFGSTNNCYSADADGLLQFLEDEVLPSHEARRMQLENQRLIREQSIGEALDPDRLEGLARYEVHLDRKLERMLAMLLRLKDLRQGTVES